MFPTHITTIITYLEVEGTHKKVHHHRKIGSDLHTALSASLKVQCRNIQLRALIF